MVQCWCLIFFDVPWAQRVCRDFLLHSHVTHSLVKKNLNSLAPGRYGNDFKVVIFKLILRTDILSLSYGIALRRMPQKPFVDKLTLVQVMACCHQATSHYLSQCWPRSMLPYGITRPQRERIFMIIFWWITQTYGLWLLNIHDFLWANFITDYKIVPVHWFTSIYVWFSGEFYSVIHIHYSDVKNKVSEFIQTTKKSSKAHSTGYLWSKSIGDDYIPCT